MNVYAVICPDCNGSHYLAGRILCSKCNGDGRILIPDVPLLKRPIDYRGPLRLFLAIVFFGGALMALAFKIWR
jgi:hypothetical protein